MKSISRDFAALCGLALFATFSQAQFQNTAGRPGVGPVARPAVSPYLNLLRGGNPAINYYGLVRPQIAAGKALQELGENVNSLEGAVTQPLQTGHTSSFMTQSRYFMTNGALATGTRGQPATQPRPPSKGR
jgi:hypothetical protein